MKRYILLPALLLFVSASFAQKDVTEEIKKLIDEEKYIEVIARYADTTKDYPAKAFFYIALAHYYRNEDEACLTYIDKSILKDPTDAAAYSIKGYTMNFLKRYEEAVLNFKKAIVIDTTNGRFLYGLGSAYFYLEKYDSALVALERATLKDNVPGETFSMIGEIYANRKEYGKAEQSFISLKQRSDSSAEAYPEVLHNIGLMQLLGERYAEAEKTYTGIVQAYPGYFYAYPKLVQIYYHNKEYDKAKPWKDVLYKAQKDQKLPESLKDMFCIDQFKWKDKLIQVFERYEEGKSQRIYYKHMFYLVNDAGDIDYRIQTEYSPAAVAMGNGPVYLLGMSQGNTHSTFAYGFKENYKYEEVKEAVINVLDKKATPASSSRPGN